LKAHARSITIAPKRNATTRPIIIFSFALVSKDYNRFYLKVNLFMSVRTVNITNLAAVNAPVTIVAAAQILYRFPFMPRALGRSLFRDIAPTVAMIAAGAEVTVAMTVLWSILLTMQAVGVKSQVPASMPLAARTQNLEVVVWLPQGMVNERIWVIWCKKV